MKCKQLNLIGIINESFSVQVLEFQISVRISNQSEAQRKERKLKVTKLEYFPARPKTSTISSAILV